MPLRAARIILRFWPLPLAFAVLSALIPACVSVGKREPPPTPVVVVGAQGTLSTASSNAVVANAVADAPDPQAIARLEALMESVSPEPLFKDNDVRLLVDGPATYVAMLSAINAATHHVNLETYIFNDDEVGRQFADALIKKRSAGVEVRVIFDSLGSRESPAGFFDRMKQAGIRTRGVPPGKSRQRWESAAAECTRSPQAARRRRGDRVYRGHQPRPELFEQLTGAEKVAAGWRDTHIEVLGPAVAGFQRLFLGNWKAEGGEALGDERRFFPRTGVRGTQLVRVLSANGGDGEVSPIRTAYGLAMEAASRRIWITQSYFGPDPDFLKTMQDAARRGVDVRIIVTGISDSQLLLNVSRSCYEELLRAGVRIYESQEIMVHAKTAVIDGVWSTIGSSNLDYRSFIHNYEVNAVIVGQDFGRAMEKLFQDDLARSQRIELAQWDQRPVIERAKENMSRLLQYWL